MAVRDSITHKLFVSGQSVPLAELRVSLEQLAALHNVPIYEDADDLDSFTFIIIPLTARWRACLYQYAGDPAASTLVRVDSHANLIKLWEKLRQTLDLHEGDYTWVAPEAVAATA